MAKYDLPSGAVLDVTPLPYGEAWDVASTILKEIDKVDIKALAGFDLPNSDDFRKFITANINDVKSPLCLILSSKKVLESAHACFKKCTYNDIRINGQTFESIESRKDFLMAAFYAIKENVMPFFEGLLSSLSAS